MALNPKEDSNKEMIKIDFYAWKGFNNSNLSYKVNRIDSIKEMHIFFK